MPSLLTLFLRKASTLVSNSAYRAYSDGCEPRELTLCSNSERFFAMLVISSCSGQQENNIPLPGRYTVVKIFLRSYSLSSGIDCSR